MPEDIDVAIVVDRDGRGRLDSALVLDGQGLLVVESASVIGTRIVETIRVLVKPSNVQAPIGTNRHLTAVDGTETVHRVRLAINPFGGRPALGSRGFRHVPQITTAHRAGVVNKVQGASLIEHRLREFRALRCAQHGNLRDWTRTPG